MLAAPDNSALATHGPVTILVELMAQHSLETYYDIKVDYPGQVGAEIRYRGHKDDLVAAGCISAELTHEHILRPFDLDPRLPALTPVDQQQGLPRAAWPD